MKKQIIFIIGIFLLLNLIMGVSALGYTEDENGIPSYESEFRIKAPSITLNSLITLKPSTEPATPELGMIYLDLDSKRLKFYDGEGWYAIALEKVSTISEQQVEKAVEKKGEVQTCEKSVDCGEWGDCINNYQSMTCITIDEICNKYTDTETKDCISENPFELPSAAKDSLDAGSSDATMPAETAPETTTPAETAPETTAPAETPSETADSEPAPAESSPSESAPEQLFDITFDLEQNSLGKSDKLVVWVTLQNFGKRYVPARLVYSITNKTGNEVYREFEEIRVYTDQSIIKRFDNLSLVNGEYTLSMDVEYAGIVEKFSSSFSVETGLFSAIKRFFVNWF